MGNNSELKNQFKLLIMIHISLVAGMLLILLVVLVLIQGNRLIVNIELDKIFTILVPVYGLIIMFISRFIFSVIISGYSAGTDFAQKIVKYRLAKIVSWALLESGCIFALVAAMLTANYLYVAVFIFLLGYFVMLRPSKQSLICDLHLSLNEADLIVSK